MFELSPLEEIYNPAPTKSVINDDAKNDGQSLLSNKKSTNPGNNMNPAVHNNRPIRFITG